MTGSGVHMQAYAYDVAAEGASTAGVELQSRGMSMSFLSEQVRRQTWLICFPPGYLHWDYV